MDVNDDISPPPNLGMEVVGSTGSGVPLPHEFYFIILCLSLVV